MDIKLIAKLGLFDEEYYLKTNPDVKKAGIDPLKHFVKHGWKEGCNPSAEFDTNFYLSTYPDVAQAAVNPLVHYIKHGKKEGRKTNPSDPTTLIPAKVKKLKKLMMLGKYATKNPHLIGKTISEIKLHGIKKTITKIKNKSHKIESSIATVQNIIDIKQILNIFHPLPSIPKFITSKPIDIVIPIYNGKEFIIPLFESIIKNTSMPFRLLVADDKSSDAEVLPLLYKIKNDNPNITMILIENEINLGFIKTVNKLAALTENHFVLLNSDTEVPPLWIERLMYPIFEMDNIASTTPFTNSGTIASFPNFLEDNPIFENMKLEELDSYFRYVNFEKTYIEIPTGVGFCMGVNKILVDKIGMFDEIFGKGYGEENDWCQKAIQEGYKNIHVTNLFVYHKHGGSFDSVERKKLQENNLNLLLKKYPDYMEQVGHHVDLNPHKDLRELLVLMISSSSHRDNLLIIDHQLGGGANVYTQEFIQKRSGEGKITFLFTYNHLSDTYYIRMHYKSYDIVYKLECFSDLHIVFQGIPLHTVLINQLIPYPDYSYAIDVILELQTIFDFRLEYLLHDYYTICPSYNLLNEKIEFCGIPSDPAICNRCLEKNPLVEKNTPYLNESIKKRKITIEKWRSAWGKLLNTSDRITVFSHASKELLTKTYPNLDKNKLDVLPHEVTWIKKQVHTKKSDTLYIGVLGYLTTIKGLNIIKDMARFLEENPQNVKIVHFGDTEKTFMSPYYQNLGPYDKSQLSDLIEKYKINIMFIPSIWPETFSYTTEECIQMDMPIAVFDLGAPAERVRHYTKGIVIDNIDCVYALNKIVEYYHEHD